MSVSFAEGTFGPVAEGYVGVPTEKLGAYLVDFLKLHSIYLARAERIAFYLKTSFDSPLIEFTVGRVEIIEITASGKMVSHNFGDELSVFSLYLYHSVFKEV